MQHQHDNGGEGQRGRWPLEHGPSGDPPTLRKIGGGRGAASHQATVPHARWNNSEWRRWDQNHGHMLWMGTLQEGWSNAIIAGFFRHHGEEVTVTRKGQDNYCFVEFETAAKATDFMTKYNHRLLPGKHGNGVRFSIKPRTRPRWYRDADSGRRDGSLGNDKDNGKRRDSRNPRLESEHDRRGGGRRPTFAGARTEARSHESYEDGQVRGVEITRPEGRGYYGQRIGDRGLRAPDSGRGGREERSSRTTPPPRRQAVPDEEGDLARPGSCKDARGGDSRSRMLPGGSAKDSIPDRSRPTSRMLSRLGPSPPRRSRSGERSQRNNESPDGCRTRRRRDPSLRQSRTTFECVVDANGASKHGRIPAAAAAAATLTGGLGEGGSQTLPPGEQDRLPRDCMRSDDTARSDERSVAMSTADDVVDRTEGSARRRSTDSEMAGGGGVGSGGDEAVGRSGRAGQNFPVLSVGSGSSEDSDTESDNEGNSHYDAVNTTESDPEEVIAMRVEGGSPGVAQKKTPVLPTTSDSDDTLSDTTASSGQARRGVEHRKLGRGHALEEGLGWKGNSPSPSTAGVPDLHGSGNQSSRRKATEYSGSDQLEQGPTRSNEASPTTVNGAEEGRAAGSARSLHVQDETPDDEESVHGGLRSADGMHTQHFSEEFARVSATKVAVTADASGAVESADRQMSGVSSSPALSVASSSREANGKNVFNGADHGGCMPERGAVHAETKNETSLQKGDTRYSGKNSSAPPAPSSPDVQSPQREPRHQVGTGLCVDPRTGNTLLFSDGAGRLDEAHECFKESSTKDLACHATPRVDESVLEISPLIGGLEGVVPSNQTPPSCKRAAEASPDVEAEATGNGFDGDASQTSSTPKLRRATKRQKSGDVDLGESVDPPMASQRLEERAPSSTGRGIERDSRCSNVAPVEMVARADTNRGSNDGSQGKGPSMVSSSSNSAVGEGVCAKRRVSPPTGMTAPHDNLAAPILAHDPGGRRVVLRTAAAVAAGAAMLALPQYHLEVTGVCGDGLLLELCPKDGGKGPLVQSSGVGTSAMLYSLADRFQAAFDGVVALDLQLHGVQLPHSEALKAVASGSSTEKLIKWDNQSTTSLLRLAPAPPSRGASSAGQAPGDAESIILLELRKVLECAGGTLFIGCDESSWRLLPRSGLLKSYKADIHPVVHPPIESTGGGSQASRYLAVTLSDSRAAFHAGDSPRALCRDGGESTRSSNVVVSNAAIVGLPQLSSVARLACGPPTCTAEGLTWRDVTNLRCVADVNKLVLGPRTDLDNKLRLAEGLHSAQIEALAKKIALSSTLLVVLAGRQGASTNFVASRLCVDLRVRGKTSAMLNTKKFLRSATDVGKGHPTGNPAAPFSRQQLDSTALGRAVAALLGQARNRDGAPASANGASVGGGDGIAGGKAEPRKWCDVVVVFGCEMLDVELLPPASFGLGPKEALSVFVDLLPQISVDNLTAIDGADVRMLRALVAAANVAETGLAHENGNGIVLDVASSSLFDTASFLQEWFVAEQRRESLWRSFHAAAPFHVNTSLPYDLHALKPKAEPLLRSVTPPVNGSQDENGGHGSPSSTYTLSRSMMSLLRLCESLYAPQLPGRSVLSGLTVV